LTPNHSSARRRRRERFVKKVRRVMLLADDNKEGARELVAELSEMLETRCEEVVVHLDLRKACSRIQAERIPQSKLPDLIIVLGGDGSILTVVRAFQNYPVPTLGINFGRIGFLASVGVQDCRAAVLEALDGLCVLEPRMRLLAEIFTERNSEKSIAVALNDLLVQRGAAQGMMSLSLHDGGTWVSDYRADGLIFSSPSGSTAHSLAAGGPILAPSMRGLVVTPISPQSLSHRPMVMHPDSVLEATVLSSRGLVTVAVDGHGFFPMRQGDRIVVSQHPVTYPLLARPASDPYVRVRERLGWRGTFEPESGMDLNNEAHQSPPMGEGEVL
jgi:NAD+ kinase